MIELHRSLAPLSERAWERIESEAAALLRTRLAARRLVDFVGPLGWEHSAIDLSAEINTPEAAVPLLAENGATPSSRR